MQRIVLLGSALVVLMLGAPSIHAGSTPGQKCAVAKSKAAAKKIGAELKCWQKALADGVATPDPHTHGHVSDGDACSAEPCS